MKIERIVLSLLCGLACVWSGRMTAGVIHLARLQGPGMLIGWFELAAFFGAGLIPLLLVWRKSERHARWLFAAWLLCVGYVAVLALNYSRFHFVGGVGQLLLWLAIIVLFLRVRKQPKPL